jgi:hypothetical protein
LQFVPSSYGPHDSQSKPIFLRALQLFDAFFFHKRCIGREEKRRNVEVRPRIIVSRRAMGGIDTL